VENLQLRPTFPDKPLIKTYVALCESCRFIAPLQLLFLEIFELNSKFLSYAISKMLKWNKKGGTRRRRRAPCVVRALRPRRPRGVLAMLRRTDPRGLRCGPRASHEASTGSKAATPCPGTPQANRRQAPRYTCRVPPTTPHPPVHAPLKLAPQAGKCPRELPPRFLHHLASSVGLLSRPRPRGALSRRH
jgi:hypothetical protein